VNRCSLISLSRGISNEANYLKGIILRDRLYGQTCVSALLHKIGTRHTMPLILSLRGSGATEAISSQRRTPQSSHTTFREWDNKLIGKKIPRLSQGRTPVPVSTVEPCSPCRCDATKSVSKRPPSTPPRFPLCRGENCIDAGN